MATAQRAKPKKGKKVTPVTQQQIDELDRPSSSLSHNSWVENLDRPESSASLNVPTPAELTAVTELPRSGSVLSVREAVEEDRVSNIDENEWDIPPPASGSRSSTPIVSRPHTPTTPMDRGRTLSPTPGTRSRSVSPRAKRRAKVNPTDGVIPNENSQDVAEPMQAWSETSSVADFRALSPDNDTATRPQSRSNAAVHPITSSPTTLARTRSPGVGMHSSRSPSTHSLISVQEAADGNRIDGTVGEEAGERAVVPARSKSVASLRSQRNQDDTKSIVSSTTSTRLKPPKIENEQQAYVPFLYARDCLAKVMDDMGKMKHNHIRIVGLIEDSYTKIEDETQAQFNVFVVGMRDQYKDKVKTFRQVIHIHQEDFGNHKTYWQETLESLNSRNKALMKDKKRLLVINKLEIDRLEKEKEQLTTDLSQKIDQEHQSYLSKEKEVEQSSQELKILEDQLTSEKTETKQLKRENERLKSTADEDTIAAATSADPSDLLEENEDLKEEIESLKASLRDGGGGGGDGVGVAGEATAVLAATTVASEQDRKRLKNERNEMQEQKIQAQKDLAITRAKYDALHTQYTLIASAASASDESKEKMQEKIDSVQKDQGLMKEEGDQLKDEIKQWNVEFEQRTGKEPTDDDKSESMRELETQLAEVENQQVELETKSTVMKALQEGQVPEVQQPIVAEPIVKTVEVTVQDPAVAAALEVSQKQCDELRAKVASLEKTIKEKDKTIKEKDKTLKDKDKTLKDKDKTIKKLEKNKTSVTKSAPAAKASSPDNDRDLKLLLKALVDDARSVIYAESDNADSVLQQRLTNSKETSDLHQGKLADAKEAVASWEAQYTQEHGNPPDESDRDDTATQLYADFDKQSKQAVQNDLDVTAWTMLGAGQIPGDYKVTLPSIGTPSAVGGVSTSSADTSGLEDRIEELEDEIRHLEDKLANLEEEKLAWESSPSPPKKDYDAMMNDIDDDDDDVEGFSAQISTIRAQTDEAERKLAQEQEHHEKTKSELEDLKQQYENLLEEKANVDEDTERKVRTATVALKAEVEMKDKNLEESKQRIDELEQEKLKDVPVDTAKVIIKLKEKLKIIVLEKEALQKDRIGGGAEIEKLRADNAALTEKYRKEKENSAKSQDAFSKKLSEKEHKSKEQLAALEKKYQGREAETRKQIQSLEKKIKELSAAGAAGGGAAKGAAGGKGGAAKVDAKTEKKLQMYQEQVTSLKKQIQEEQNKTKAAKDDLKEFKSAGAGDKQAGKKIEKQMKDLEKKLEMVQKKYDRENTKSTEMEAELKTTSKELDTANEEIKKLQSQISSLGVAAEEALELKEKVDDMAVELKTLKSESKTLTENYNSERVLRKKYYNQIEDMKGKIRVYCRGRPLSGSEKERGNYEVVKAPDEYTITVDAGQRGIKEFQFDHIFLAGSSQAEIFEDTNNLIQSAVDGYNVCIFAYGQTGSGKTFTMIGDKEQKFPGVAPRAFNRIFEVMEESQSKFSFKVSTYMLELYNERLIDLYAHGKGEHAKLDIKKDQKGMVFINGAIVQDAANAKELYGLFDAGSLNRHVASTKMNSESSRSHLVIGIIIESTNLSTGTVVRGKLSLVDLAGSERAAKTGATPEQLKEANSINKSLSALGDVISALSSEQGFIPYRNNKLTMLMQDSLGGNAKTLMFVNISPADYNADETVISLTYASRVKLITNDASKNSDNKEIARLKNVIEKLKKGEDVNPDVNPEDDVE